MKTPEGQIKKLSVNHKQIPTGITQNIKDLLASREIENIFENSDFIYMLNQAAGDRQILAKQLNISPHQLSYVTNSGEGEGLIFYGNVIIPFKDRFNHNLRLYSLMTTKTFGFGKNTQEKVIRIWQRKRK
mgnify:CR=1 FL=1